MSRTARRQKSEVTLHSLVEQFSTRLVNALRECASGKWGLFGQNDVVIASSGKYPQEILKPTVAESLVDDGEKIELLRQELGYTEPCPLFRRYREYCQMKGSNVPGEPKLAMEFLKELGIEQP